MFSDWGLPNDKLSSPTQGKRTPNGLKWAHNPRKGFGYVGGTDNVWSRSMLEEVDPQLAFKLWSNPYEANPRPLLPWPILKLTSNELATPEGFSLGVTDDRCCLQSQPIGAEQDLEGTGGTEYLFPSLDIGNATDATQTSIPKLEESIPPAFFPEILFVSQAPRHRGWSATIARKYIRLFPTLDKYQDSKLLSPLFRPDTKFFQPEVLSHLPSDLRTADLDLSSAPLLGVGHHSQVYCAPLQLPDPLTACSPTGKVSVAAKVSFGDQNSLDMLHHEGRIYDSFPRHLMEDWSGHNYLPEASYDVCTGAVPACAVVPKFYGYYIPIIDDSIDEDEAFTPILLMEECGVPMNTAKLTSLERADCYSLPFRLHDAGYVQNSFSTRNLVVQPGPLTDPPYLRSMKQPSFRIIDFGRARHRADPKKSDRYTWNEMVKYENRYAKNVVYGEYVKCLKSGAKMFEGEYEPGSFVYRRPYAYLTLYSHEGDDLC